MSAPAATKRCLVFGGSGAIGSAVCRALSAQGARIAFTYCTRERAARALESELPGSTALCLDLASIDSVHRTIEDALRHLNGLDAFVQCAGVTVSMPYEGETVHHRMSDVDEGGWNRMMDINVKGVFFAARRVVEIMRTSGGNILFIGSVASEKLTPAPVHFGAAKGAIRGMTMAMAKEFGDAGIRANLIAPGLTSEGASKVLPDDELREYLKHCGLKRTGTPAEIANVAAWFALHNTYVTGQSIVVDGGL